MEVEVEEEGRGGGIRTHGLFVPNEARYQAAPHPECLRTKQAVHAIPVVYAEGVPDYE